MSFHCPHCQQPIDPALIRKAAAKDVASRPRPGSLGKPSRNPAGRPSACEHYNVAVMLNFKGHCLTCNRPVRYDEKAQRWRTRYAPKKPRPAA